MSSKKAATTTELSRPKRKPPATTNLPLPVRNDSHSMKKRSAPISTAATTGSPPKQAAPSPQEERKSRRAQTSNNYSISNIQIPEHIEPSKIPVRKRLGYTKTRHDPEPTDRETTKKKPKDIASISKRTVAGSLDAEPERIAEAGVPGSIEQQVERNDVLVEASSPSSYRSRRSALFDRRKHGTALFENLSNTEKRRRNTKRFSIDLTVRKTRDQDSGVSGSNASLGLSTEDLVGRSWRLYYASPLYGLNRTPRALKQYGRELRSYLTSARSALPDAGDVRYSAVFTNLPGLRWKENQSDGLQVQVLSLADNRKPIALYTGVLVAWGDESPAPPTHSTTLPLLLCAGVVRTMRNVHCLLGRLFDTVLLPLEPNQEDFKWVAAISLDHPLPPPDKPLHVHYASGAAPGGEVCLSVSALSVHRLWRRIHKVDSEQVVVDEVELLHARLVELMAPLNCIEMEMQGMVRIDFPHVALWRDGRIKVTNEATMDFTLRYFCSRAVATFEKSCVELHTPAGGSR